MRRFTRLMVVFSCMAGCIAAVGCRDSTRRAADGDAGWAVDGESGGDALADGDGTGGGETGPSRWEDPDRDGVPHGIDNCLGEANPQQADDDNDGRGNPCDNCPQTSNYPQVDSDGDGTGDACESEPSGPICRTRESDFEIVKPNIYIVVDRSSSMSNEDMTSSSRMERAKAGLDQVATELAGDVRLGISTYPCGESDAACNTLNYEVLPIGEHTAQQFRQSYQNPAFSDSTCPGGDAAGLNGLDIEEAGMHLTETGAALRDVLNRQLYRESDPSTERPSRIVLITDGNACGCGDNGCSGHQNATISALTDLRNRGVQTFVVGFNFDSQLLNEAAEAGGTNAMRNGKKYFDASSPAELVDALEDIRDRTIKCEYELTPAPPDSAKLWVSVDGSYISRSQTDGYSYDESNATVTIHGSACDTLKNAQGNTVPLEIKMGCACDSPPCQCRPNGSSCSVDDDCCAGICENGTCNDACYPLGTSCQDNGDCCSQSCTATAQGKQCTGS